MGNTTIESIEKDITSRKENSNLSKRQLYKLKNEICEKLGNEIRELKKTNLNLESSNKALGEKIKTLEKNKKENEEKLDNSILFPRKDFFLAMDIEDSINLKKKLTKEFNDRMFLLDRNIAETYEKSFICQICFENKKSMVLNCGHIFCEQCSSVMTFCPNCRQTISSRKKVYL